jgi:imidazole glycerol-phosphate synthase subunit HisH
VPTVAIVDYGLCNLDSVRRAVEDCGGHPMVTSRPDDVVAADYVILPGVGAFPQAMANLRKNGLDHALRRRVIEDGRPFLGICLGMQLLASIGHEGQATEGLAWVDGEVQKLKASNGARVPHVGWNEVHVERPIGLFDGVANGSDFYFVHSYALYPRNACDVLACTPHGAARFPAVVGRDNIAGVQFHPEKSQRVGFAVLRNFLRRA